MDIKLYHCREARSLRPLWLLEELEIPFELVNMPFPPRERFEGYLDVNPLGTVPTAVIDGVTMTESSAMCQFIAESSAPTPLHVDADDPERSRYLDWLHRSDTTFTVPLVLFLRYTMLEPENRRSAQVAEDYRIWFYSRAAIIEQSLADQAYLCAGRFTAADVSVAYALYLASKLGLADDLGAKSRDYLDRCTNRPAFQQALEKQSVLEPTL